MRSDLTARLYERYPALFVQRRLHMLQSSMWMGFSCRDGWFELIDALCAKLNAGVEAGTFPQPEAVQIKEKYGELRFYLDRPGDEAIRRLIDEARDRSLEICEVCGAAGALRVKDDWYRTRCDLHSDSGSVIVQPG